MEKLGFWGFWERNRQEIVRFSPGRFFFCGDSCLDRRRDAKNAPTLPLRRDTTKTMKNKSANIITVILAAGVFCAGCKGTLGTDSVNVSGSVLSGGKIIGGSLTVSSNTISVGGSVAQGDTTNSGSITVGN
jgi:hypothetical protein